MNINNRGLVKHLLQVWTLLSCCSGYLMLTSCSYIIGYVIVYNGGYQDRDEVVSAVTTKVNGDYKYGNIRKCSL